MNKLVYRLFRDPSDAKQAVEHLLSSGYSAQDIGVMAPSEAKAKSVLGQARVPVHPVDNVVAAGCLVPALTKTQGPAGTLSARLKEVLGVGTDIADYFSFGLGTSGVLVVVSTEEARAAEARAILGQPVPVRKPVGVASPGFEKAGRMSATNPVDATMTGDFRKY